MPGETSQSWRHVRCQSSPPPSVAASTTCCSERSRTSMRRSSRRRRGPRSSRAPEGASLPRCRWSPRRSSTCIQPHFTTFCSIAGWLLPSEPVSVGASPMSRSREFAGLFASLLALPLANVVPSRRNSPLATSSPCRSSRTSASSPRSMHRDLPHQGSRHTRRGFRPGATAAASRRHGDAGSACGRCRRIRCRPGPALADRCTRRPGRTGTGRVASPLPNANGIGRFVFVVAVRAHRAARRRAAVPWCAAAWARAPLVDTRRPCSRRRNDLRHHPPGGRPSSGCVIPGLLIYSASSPATKRPRAATSPARSCSTPASTCCPRSACCSREAQRASTSVCSAPMMEVADVAEHRTGDEECGLVHQDSPRQRWSGCRLVQPPQTSSTDRDRLVASTAS